MREGAGKVDLRTVQHHRLLKFLSALSLLICVAVCVLWCRSYWRADYLWFQTKDGHAFSTISSNGALQWKGLRDLRESSGGYGPPLRAKWTTRSLRSTDVNDLSVAILLLLDPLTFEDGGVPSPVALQRFAVGSATGSYPGLRDGSSWSSFGPDYRYVYLVTPYWALALAAGGAPAFRAASWWRRGRRRRTRLGLCTTCGYDLRATPDRCPECGRAAA
jgi:hypothetical protein